MARSVDCDHHEYLLDDSFLGRFEAHLEHLVHLTDGHYLSQCVTTPTLPTYRDLGIEVLLRGHGGELMHLDKAYNFSMDREAFLIRDENGLERWLSRRLRAFLHVPMARPLFSRQFASQIEDLACDSLRACLRESESFDPPIQRIGHLFLSQRLRRETALSMVEFGSVVETRLPYLDPDFIAALISAPPKLRLSDTIACHILQRRMPAFLDVVNANTGTRLGTHRLTRLLARARLKVLSKLRVPGYQPYERLGLWLRQPLRPLVERLLLDDRSLERGIFDPEAVRSVVATHLNGQQNHTFLLMALMIFEVGQRQFVDGDGMGVVGRKCERMESNFVDHSAT